ncbi:hypothetical protein Acid345_1940 [Candidatus Koribacter versatilis Ellin345]|uniref:Uncharacterized protein n=1 Tax=Koribacter versatilis (strain Ellin345) TaxID=204669 RepID=Q1IQA9_KORVE|nr:hypothetical protein [Candidatus Koribacter versatilis]ABF40941.1 hypothetical protein Acid345_1940 [Candidatus Koribacter versatilis Ellin345]
MASLSQLLFERMRDAIQAWPEQIAADIYAVSARVHDDQDDPRKPTLTFEYNTLQYWKAIPIGIDKSGTPSERIRVMVKNVKAGGRLSASSSEEAAWNYAFWPKSRRVIFGDSSDSDFIRRWIDEAGLSYTRADEDNDFERTIALGEQINRLFMAQVIAAVQQLHASPVLVSKIGKPVPVIIHDLEYYDAVLYQTKQANPPGLADDFCAWVNTLGKKLI